MKTKIIIAIVVLMIISGLIDLVNETKYFSEKKIELLKNELESEKITDEEKTILKINSENKKTKIEINKINDYINYVKNNIKKIDDNHIDLIVSLIEVEKLSWEQLKGEQLWNSLKKDNSGISYEKFINELKWELKN